ncbi:hypothetical protein Sango_0623100 [Sesamum angolense]|uniref:Uncharacterized protein n=1 Tax=Sesamum angolense TaxID=2727404 RepID=A0AAE1X6N6_9LAMI|nr:hypothetical protein Sango_0623100 [Sesamum angolense]
MRRHRAGAVADDQNLRSAPAVSEAPVVKRANSRRVLCMDLNLTPLENKFVFGDIGASLGRGGLGAYKPLNLLVCNRCGTHIYIIAPRRGAWVEAYGLVPTDGAIDATCDLIGAPLR